MSSSIMRLAWARRWHRYSDSRECACYSIRLPPVLLVQLRKQGGQYSRCGITTYFGAANADGLCRGIYALSLCEHLATEFSSAFATQNGDSCCRSNP